MTNEKGDEEKDKRQSQRRERLHLSLSASASTSERFNASQQTISSSSLAHLNQHEIKEERHDTREGEGEGRERERERDKGIVFRSIADLGRDLLHEVNEKEGEDKEEKVIDMDGDGIKSHQVLLTARLFPSRSSENQRAPNHPLDELAAVRDQLWDTTPVEKDIYKNHTRCFGLFFSTLEMERAFLDSHARLKRKIVYWGYALLVLVTVYISLTELFRNDVVTSICTDEIPLCSQWTENSSADRLEFLAVWGKYFYSAVIPLAFVGCCLHWLIHQNPKVKEKSWTFLVVFLVECLVLVDYNVGGMINLGGNGEYIGGWWPYFTFQVTVAILAILFFFSGIVSFVLVFLLLIFAYAISCIAYFCWTLPNAMDMYGYYSQAVQTLMNAMIYSSLVTLPTFLIYLVASYLMEIANRKEFLQRMLVHTQQKQIIREKSKNEDLQRQLLENMLPTSIVDQLQRQNFTVSSWDELRALSHRHFGVSIMFAEVENFTVFSSEVAPAHVMEYLNELFLIFDDLCERHEVYKVETVGDQYVAAVGVVTGEMLTENTLSMRGSQLILSTKSLEDIHESKKEYSGNFDKASIQDAACFNTAHMISYAKAIIEGSRGVVLPPETEACPVLRVGIHTGSCMSGIVGMKNFRFCLFGDTMNTAARMEQTSVAGCIHVTEEVVALAPGHSWEKLEKLNVKGKGSMQTYLLRVSCDGLNFETGAAASENAHPNPQDGSCSLSVEEEEGSVDMLTSGHFVRCKTGVGSGGKSSGPDVSPVKGDVFRSHTKWLGLVFKESSVERVFYDTHARLHKNDVYLGYFLFVLTFLISLLYAYLSMQKQFAICVNPALKDFCIDNFGESLYETASYSIDGQASQLSGWEIYKILISFGFIRMTPVITGLLSILFAYGILSHWVIHRVKRFERKSWALLNVWVVYISILILLDVTIVFFRLPGSYQWPMALKFLLSTQSTLLVLCTGVPFVLNLAWWIIGYSLYFGFAIPVVLQGIEAIDEENDYNSVPITRSFFDGTADVFWYSVVLLIGSYMNDVNNRKRFLQRILLVEQQGQIIRAKAKNERTQKTFLENILPPSLVEELQVRQEDESLEASRYRRLKSLSKSHVAVSMMFADLVGFTAFSSQVDPFKVMSFLNDLFHVFDGLCDQYNVYKLETIGDCYVATVGLVTGNMVSAQLYAHDVTLRESMRGNKEAVTNAKDLVGFAKAMLIESRQVMKPVVNTPALMRIGLHTGSCISGIVGTKILKFCTFGDLVVTAAEMEKSGTPGCIHASQDVVDLVPEEQWEERTTRTTQKKKKRKGKTTKDEGDDEIDSVRKQQTYLLVV